MVPEFHRHTWQSALETHTAPLTIEHLIAKHARRQIVTNASFHTETLT